MQSALPKPALPALGALFVVAAFFLVLVRPGLVDEGGLSLGTSYDLHSAFLPKFAFGSGELLRGHLPLWNPHEFAGIPLLATAQPAAFYPPKVLVFAAFGPEAGYWVFMVAHFVALVFGFLLFCKEERIEGAPALVGTLLWTFAIPVMTSNYHPTRVANLVWMPVMFVLVERLARRAGRHTFALLALVVALQLTAGYPEFTLDLALLITVHATARWALGEWTAPPHRTVPLIAAAFALGALVAAVQLVPLAELGAVARRTLVAASERGATENLPLGMRLVAAVGLFPGLVALSVIGTTTRRARTALAGTLALSVMASTGWLLLGKLPGFGMIRFPWVWLFIGSFYLAWLAAAGAQLVTEQREAPSRHARIASLVLATAALGWAALCAVQWQRLASGSSVSVALLSPLTRTLGSTATAVLGMIGGVSLAAAVLASLRRRVPDWAFGVPAILLALGQLAGYPYGQYGAPVKRPGRSELLARLNLPSPLGPGRVLSLRDIAYGYNLTDGVSSVLGAEVSFLPWRYRRVTEKIDLSPFAQHLDWQALAKMRGFLDAMDLRYLSIHPSVVWGLRGARLDRVAESPDEVLFENVDRMGPAWVCEGVYPAKSEADAGTYVLGARFDPHWEVVLEEATRHTYPRRSPLPASRPAWVRRPSSTEVVVSVNLTRPGLLVVADTAFPGWEAFVNDRPTPWMTANYVHRAVELDAGEHLVRFEYRPRSVRWGLGLSALGSALLAGLFFRQHLARIGSRALRRSPREPHPPPG